MANNIVELEYNTELTENQYSNDYIKEFDSFLRNECKTLDIDILNYDGKDKYILRGFKYAIVKLFFNDAKHLNNNKELELFWNTIEKNSKKLKNYYLKILKDK